jgi:putative inorganic carbon (hco3(-)) transporter
VVSLWQLRRPDRVWLAALALSAGLVLAALPLELAALVAVAAPVAAAASIWPQFLLFALPLTVPFSNALSLGIAGARVGLAELGVAALMATWLAKSVSQRRLRVPTGPLGKALLLWCWTIGLSLLVATSLKAGFSEAAKWAEVLLVFLAALSILRLGDLRYLVYGVAAAGVLSALAGLFQFATGRGPEGFLLFGRFIRAYGTFAQPNPFSGHLGLSLPFALAWALVARPSPRLERLVLLGAAGVMLMGILASWSRGGWLAIGVAVALMLAMLYPRLTAGVVLVALLMGPFLGSSIASSPLAQRALGMGGDVSGLNVARVVPTTANFAVVERLAHWQAAWYMFAARPWLGVGIGNFETVYPGYALSQWPAALGHAHNYILNVAAETGLVGVLVYGLLGVVTWLVAARTWRRAADPRARAAVLAAVGSLAYLTIHNLVDDLYVHGMQILVALALGVLAVALRNAEEPVAVEAKQCR